MALKRATKSIPLSGGIVEEVDDFLLEPAGMQYMENVRFTKTDQAEKVEPTTVGGSTGATNHTQNVYGLWTDNDTVAVVSNDSVRYSEDAGATWTGYAQNTDLLGIERVLSTIEGSGAINFTWAPLGNYTASPKSFVVTGYACAWERVRQDTSLIDNFRDVVLAYYNPEGRLLQETVVSNAHSPRIQRSDDGGLVSMLCVSSAGDIVHYNASPLFGGFLFVNTYARTIRDYCQQYNTTNKGWGAPGAELLPEEMRMGYQQLDMRDNNSAFVYRNPFLEDFGVIAYKVGASIYWERTQQGVPVGSPQLLQTDSDPLYFAVLACETDGLYNYFLISQTNTTTPAAGTQLWIYRELVTGGTIATFQFASGLTGQVCNGSLKLSDDEQDMYVAYTTAFGGPTENMKSTFGLHRVTATKLTGTLGTFPPTVSATTSMFSHRLVSHMTIDKDNLPHFVVQQWGNWNPDPATSGGSPDIPALSPVHQKPVTSIQVRWDWAEDAFSVIASYDAGQSKYMPASLEEQNIHLLDLHYFDSGLSNDEAHEFWFGNRNLLTAEDHWYYLTNATANVFPANDARISLHPGTARLNIYRIQSAIRVPATVFSNGMFCGTSVPVWYDGGSTIVEATTLDSPEIVYATMDGNGASYLAYQDIGLAGEEPKVVQAVVGYYDDSGLAHRSAPSFPLYIGNAKADSTTAKNITISVSPPLSISTNRQYFVEAYESFPGGVPQLAATSFVRVPQAGSTVTVNWATNVNPTTGVKPLDVTDFRSSKSLYTAGNVLAADPWPSFDLLVSSGRRVFAHSISDPSAVYYSKTFENGIAPEFSASLVVSLGNEEITAMGAIDDKVILWTRDATWFMYGTGPDNTGANGDFFLEKLPHNLGCIDPESVQTYEGGVAFFSNSTREFHVLTRDLQVVDIGENVKTLTGGAFDIRRSLVYPEAHEIRWYCDQTSGPEYVPDSPVDSPPQPPRPFLESQIPALPVFTYNFKYGKWSVSSEGIIPFNIVAILNGKPCGLKGFSFATTTEEWNTSVRCKWETPWIKVNQLQDYGRFWGLTFLGKYLSSWKDNGAGVEAGDLQVTIKYDYEGAEAIEDVHRFRANQGFGKEYGKRLQFEVAPKRQKCQAIKIFVEEIPTEKVELWEPDYTTGQGIVLTGVDIHYGAKGTSGDKSLPKQRKR